MNSSRWMSRALCAATPLVFAGCMYPGPYTYGTNPGYGGPPPGYAPPPGGTIVTPGPGFPSPQLGPSTAPPQNWQPTPALTPSPQPSLGPPSTPPSTFNEGPAPFDSGARKPGNIPVPDPLDRDSGPALDPARPDPRPSSSNTNRPFGGDGSQETFGKGAQITTAADRSCRRNPSEPSTRKRSRARSRTTPRSGRAYSRRGQLWQGRSRHTGTIPATTTGTSTLAPWHRRIRLARQVVAHHVLSAPRSARSARRRHSADRPPQVEHAAQRRRGPRRGADRHSSRRFARQSAISDRPARVHHARSPGNAIDGQLSRLLFCRLSTVLPALTS